MIVVIGVLRCPPAEADALAPHLEAMVRESRKEQGALYFSLLFDPSEPGLVRASEIFANEEALSAHRASPHMAAWREVTAHCQRDLNVFSASAAPL